MAAPDLPLPAFVRKFLQTKETYPVMKRALLVLLFGMLLGPGSGAAQDKTAHSPAAKFDPGRDAAKDIQNAMVEAQKTSKRILLDVGGEWCIWCRRLDTLFSTNKDLAEVLHKEFVVVKVNYSKENKNEAVLSRYPKIPGYPHLFVLDESGKLLHSQDTGELESGKGHDRDKVMAFLKKWGPSSARTGKGS
jgi:thioredoxin-related protein